MHKFLKEELRWGTLKYKKVLNESGYQNEKQNYQRWTFRVFFFLLTLMTFFLWLAGYGSEYPFSPFRLAVNILRLLSPFLVQLLINRYPTWIEGIIILITTISTIFYIEINRSFFLVQGPANIFTYGVLTQTLCVYLIIMRISFPRLIIHIFFINFYVAFRIFFAFLPYQGLVLPLSNFLLLTTFAYGKELYLRKLHFDIKKYENSLFLYEILMKEIIPLSVIIYDDKEIYFTNKETDRIMNIKADDNIKEKLQETFVKDIKYLDSRTVDPFFTTQKSEEIALGSFYNLMKKVVPRNDIFSCTIQAPESIKKEEYGADDSINIKFKISRIYWNEKKVKIILIEEDHNAKELKMLEQREKFKDQFLATVSHELRTPLNGIIGMISVAQTNCKEKTILKR